MPFNYPQKNTTGKDSMGNGEGLGYKITFRIKKAWFSHPNRIVFPRSGRQEIH